MNLTKETRDRIEKDAEAYGESHQDHLTNIKEYSTYNDIVGAYNAGALTEAERAQPAIEVLEQIQNSPTPFNRTELEIWIETARNMASAALAKYKEVENG